MNTLFKIISYLILLFLTGLTHLHAQSSLPIILTDEQEQYPLGLHLEILEDPEGQLTIEQVSSSAYDQQFVPNQVEVPNLGFTNSTYWVRFRVKNDAQQSKQWYLEMAHPSMERISFYRPRLEEAGFRSKQTGFIWPFKSREMAYHTFVFKLSLPPQIEQIFYLRFDSGGDEMTFPLTIWSVKALLEKSQIEQLLAGLFFGALLIMIGYNTFLFLFLKEKSYLYYVLFVTSFLCHELLYRGFLARIDYWNFIILSFSFSLTVIFALQFTKTFLATKTRVPNLHQFMTFLSMIWGLLIIFFLLNVPHSFIAYTFEVLLITVTLLTIFIAAFTTWRQGYEAARYFLIAWMMLLITGITSNLVRLGLLPNHILAKYDYQVSAILLVLLLSLALADKINIFKTEKEKAQIKALKASQENERLIREQAVILEQQVAERTQDLERARKKAELANQAKSTFLAGMSHELRTPLNGVLGFAQILQRDASMTSQQQHALKVIDQSGHHLLALINDVLDLAKIESGKIELYKSDFNLLSLLNGVSEIIKIRAKHKGIHFKLELPSDLPNQVYGDERRLRQILLNLLGNAVKFTDQGCITLKVANKSENINSPNGLKNIGYFYFQIADTGIGIALEHLDTIFKPFEQVGDQEHQAKGTGLGLAISKNLVELMGGQLCVSSQLNLGTQFWFELTLPIINDQVAHISSQQTIIGIKGKPPKILVVEDNQENQAVLINLLVNIGFEVKSAQNGREGLATAISWQPDAIITDLIMPVMDGFELIRQLRQSPLLKDKIIIASSASVYESDKNKSLAVGSDAFLPKPIQFETLFAQLQHSLHLSYVYEEKVTETAEEPQTGPMVLPEMAQLEKLYELTLMADIDELEKHITILTKSDIKLKSFVTKIQTFLKKYQIGQLKEWLEGVIGK
jgi:signal transduction histidine kinase/DNA-binding NarL/FixJ family response regulator